ncbi:hypothetical protein [Nostoc sp.]|uniref:hypothetical protein n=1 Tax=Nostoc sp. TaxID=1180 RepID=UPI003FA58548
MVGSTPELGLWDISKCVHLRTSGDRCAVRMMLYKMEYDGPTFPFYLTRTTNIADVADAIEHGFDDMWNPAFLHYSPDAGRIYHRVSGRVYPLPMKSKRQTTPRTICLPSMNGCAFVTQQAPKGFGTHYYTAIKCFLSAQELAIAVV